MALGMKRRRHNPFLTIGEYIGNIVKRADTHTSYPGATGTDQFDLA